MDPISKFFLAMIVMGGISEATFPPGVQTSYREQCLIPAENGNWSTVSFGDFTHNGEVINCRDHLATLIDDDDDKCGADEIEDEEGACVPAG